jgi:hypothetical protein
MWTWPAITCNILQRNRRWNLKHPFHILQPISTRTCTFWPSGKLQLAIEITPF